MLGSMALEVIPPQKAMPQARAAAQKALEMDDSLGEAHVTLAYISTAYDYDWETVLNGFERAVALNPGYATAHHWFAVVLSRMGDLDLAQSEINKAHELDSFSLQINSEISAMSYFRRDYERAVEHALKTLELEPTFPTTHAYLALAYLQRKMFTGELRHAKKPATSWGHGTSSLELMAGWYTASGKKSKAKALIGQLQKLSKQQYVSAFTFAWIYSLLHDKEAALAHLEHAYAERSSYVMLLKMEPSLNYMRSDPRFRDLQKRVGLSH